MNSHKKKVNEAQFTMCGILDSIIKKYTSITNNGRNEYSMLRNKNKRKGSLHLMKIKLNPMP